MTDSPTAGRFLPVVPLNLSAIRNRLRVRQVKPAPDGGGRCSLSSQGRWWGRVVETDTVHVPAAGPTRAGNGGIMVSCVLVLLRIQGTLLPRTTSRMGISAGQTHPEARRVSATGYGATVIGSGGKTGRASGLA